MSVCPSCGHGNQAGAKFCSECGAALTIAEPLAREERKVVTVLFADLVGFTSRAEQMDPEDVRALLSQYYARLRAELERFGGTVEKFIGDAVMALFGAPVAHEDDPERAVRAALAIRDWVREEEQIQARVAVHTGEALIMLAARLGQGEGMAAGDVVNTAARLQAAAPVNGILVGERTYRQTRAAIEYRPAPPVEAKGKRDPVPVWEAVQARARLGVDVPHLARTALVGRDRELGVLRDMLARARAERSPQLVTLVGVPGIGKSRLVFELRQIAEADGQLISWRQGRSLPYGEGVSFWALAEMVKAQAGILEDDSLAEAGVKLAATAAEVLGGIQEADWVARHLGALVGLGGGVPGGGDRSEAFAAWRQFVEALAEARPLVLVFEDLHWADDGLLDFVDYLAGWAGQVPLLVVGTTRPELLARRPGWGGGTPNALTLSLAPLSEQDTARLIGSLLGRPVLEAGQQAALLAQAGGNPLYAEQYVQMLAEQGAGRELPLPESVQGIIAARLDLLAPPDKRLLQDAAVVGKVFWPGAVAALGGGPGRSELEECLHGLERRQFVRRERASSVAGETQYAFPHVLVRDVAYGQIPRAVRAVKHAAAAGWIESLGRAEDHAEMLAQHYLVALDLARAAGQDSAGLAPRARTALQAAGDRAAALTALAAAAAYYRAALARWPPDAQAQRAGLLRLLGTALREVGELDQAEAVLAEGSQLAAAAGAAALAARIRILLAEIRTACGGPEDQALAECQAAAAVLEAEGDLEGLAEAWTLTGIIRFWRGDSPAGQQALERAIADARQGGHRRAQMQASTWLAATFMPLPIPVDAAIARTEQLLQAANGEPWAEADILGALSDLYAYAGRFADARRAIARIRSVYESSGAKLRRAHGAARAGEVELIAGDPAAAEHYLREAYEAYRTSGARTYLSTVAGWLAEALYAQGRLDEARQMTEQAQAAAAPADIDAQARWRAARAKVLAQAGQFPAAHTLLDEAAALASPTCWAALQAEIPLARAEVDRLAGAPERAEASLRAALRIYQDRHATPLEHQAAAALADLTGHPSAKPA
ncbi:MAG TPA: adenylate/guanylate cyclase domain-containing protein [Streptosporangiaceae bacterium]|jgi:class 3 adenylate cyclase/tetratricopeptide (TPR) repeat protein|nr:adenylate/guanylate cyclase domain-containing protein [Streptosporangiaceae bacterium]